MRATQLSTQKEADDLAAAVALKLGYPKLGVDIGGGRHGPPFFTQFYGVPISHPIQKTIAFPFFPLSEALVPTLKGEGSMSGAATVADLPADWFT